MKIQASLWIVTAVLVLAAGLVYALSITPSPSLAVNNPTLLNEPATSGPALAEKPLESLSPVLTQTDAFEFLDPVPVGKKAPDFTAKTADGKMIRLADFKNKKNLVLVFYQGSFCSVCAQQLANLQENRTHFNAQDAEIIAVSADDTAHSLNSVGELGLSFKVVPDFEKKLIKSFGVANISKKNIAWPSLFVVDKKGMVRLSFANRDGQRLHSQDILPILARITGKPAPHLNYE